MRKDFRFRLCCACMLFLILAGCKVKKPDDVLSESTMENLLYDYHIAKAMSDNLPYSDNYKKALYAQSVFDKYGVTEAAFDSSMVWYTRNTDVLAKVYEKVTKRLKTKQDGINHLIAIRDKKPTTSAPGDSIDVWAWQRMVRLSGMPIDNKYSFVLPSDSNFKERDTLVWQARYQFLNDRLQKNDTALIAMQIVYTNDSVINKTKRINRSGTEIIRLHSDSLGMIKEVRGFIYYAGKELLPTLLIDRIALTRYHSNDSLPLLNDSIHSDSAKIKVPEIRTGEDPGTAHKQELQERIIPEEMNRRRTNMRRVVKPEQLEVENHIQQEKNEQRKERQLNNQRRQQQRTNSGQR